MNGKLLFKKLREDVILPRKAHETDAGYDIYAPYDFSLEYEQKVMLGFAVAIPDGYVGIIVPRSSTGIKGLHISNTVGVIDSGYRGEVMATLDSCEIQIGFRKYPLGFKAGDRILQLLILPIPQLETMEVDELPASDRGEGGYGSTGK